jgi:hypothetical protein
MSLVEGAPQPNWQERKRWKDLNDKLDALAEDYARLQKLLQTEKMLLQGSHDLLYRNLRVVSDALGRVQRVAERCPEADSRAMLPDLQQAFLILASVRHDLQTMRGGESCRECGALVCARDPDVQLCAPCEAEREVAREEMEADRRREEIAMGRMPK